MEGGRMEHYEENGIQYLVRQNSVSVLGFSNNGFVENLIIPALIKNKPVKYVHTEAFMNTNIKSLKFPNTITSIEQRAFADCHELQHIENYAVNGHKKVSGIKDWITLGDYAFNYCIKLQTVQLINDYVYVEIGAFSNCLSLVKMDANLSGIRKKAFYNCLSLKQISLQDAACIYGDSIEKSGIQRLDFCGNATMPQKIENHIRTHNIVIRCVPTSDLLHLGYGGVNVELLY